MNIVHQALSAFDLNGNFLWRKGIILGFNHLDMGLVGSAKTKRIYALTNSGDVTCINLNSGNTLWTKEISSIYKTTAINHEGMVDIGIRPVSFEMIFDEKVGLIVAHMIWDGENPETVKYLNSKFMVFNPDGSIEHQKKKIDENRHLKIYPSKRGFKLVNDKEVNVYEK